MLETSRRNFAMLPPIVKKHPPNPPPPVGNRLNDHYWLLNLYIEKWVFRRPNFDYKTGALNLG